MQYLMIALIPWPHMSLVCSLPSNIQCVHAHRIFAKPDFLLFQVDLYLHPSINNDSPKVAYALQQCRERIKEESFKAAEVIQLCV